jgi:XTP/dITP diphosphohydrolase
MSGVTLAKSIPLALTLRVATSNPGKLRDFAAAAAAFGVTVEPLPGLASIAPPSEDAPTFESNAAKKAEYYSRIATDELVLADDSGLCVDELEGAPGVHSARYAARDSGSEGNSSDEQNNTLLLLRMRDVPEERRKARFVCVIAIAKNGRLVACFRGEVPGRILTEARGTKGFGYDPLFLVPEVNKTFAELEGEEKARYSHRGLAFRKVLKWLQSSPGNEGR